MKVFFDGMIDHGEFGLPKWQFQKGEMMIDNQMWGTPYF
jgi:hypothetical protein